MKKFWYEITAIDSANGGSELHSYHKNKNSTKPYQSRKFPYSYKIQKIEERHMNHLENLIINSEKKIIASFKYSSDAQYYCNKSNSYKSITSKENYNLIIPNNLPKQLNLFD